MNFETFELGNLTANGFTAPTNAKHLTGGTFQIIKTGVANDIKLLFEGSLDGTNYYTISEEEIILLTAKTSQAYSYQGLHDYVRVGVELLVSGSIKVLFKGAK